jgi:hypothetical protein
MRKNLLKIRNDSAEINAVFLKYSFSKDGNRKPLILFRNIEDKNKEKLTDHCFVDMNEALWTFGEIRCGERITFTANICRYKKSGGEVDYKFVKVRDITGRKSHRDPLPKSPFERIVFIENCIKGRHERQRKKTIAGPPSKKPKAGKESICCINSTL